MSVDTDKLRESIESAAQAAACTGRASVKLAQAIAPVVRNQVRALPGHVASVPSHVAQRAATPVGRKALAVQAAVGLAAIGGIVAAAAHLVCHVRAMKSYRAQKRGLAQWEATLSSLFDRAESMYPAQRFEDLYEEGAFSGEYAQTAAPGCFAILGYPMDFDEEDGDWFAYDDVYVGAGSNMADAVHKQLSGRGNLYVGADMSCERPLYVLTFPCELYQVYDLRDTLIDEFEAQESYNRVSDIDEIE